MEFRKITLKSDNAKNTIDTHGWGPHIAAHLEKVSGFLATNDEYFPDIIEASGDSTCGNAIVLSFFEDRINSQIPHSCFILEGQVGSGKTSFIRWWNKKSVDKKALSIIIDVNQKGLDFKNRKLPISNYILDQILNHWRFILADQVVQGRLIQQISEYAMRYQFRLNDKFNEFVDAFYNQNDSFLMAYKGDHQLHFLFMLLIASQEKNNQPAWIFIDNVDMESKEVQEEFIREALDIYEFLTTEAYRVKFDLKLHIGVTIRPETKLRFKGHCSRLGHIHVAEPPIIEIAKRKIENAIDRAMIYASDPGYEIETKSGHKLNSVQTFDLLKQTLHNAWFEQRWPWLNPRQFHFSLVAGDVRRFLNFYCHLILSTSYLDFWAYPILEEPKSRYFSTPYVYLRSLIVGQYTYFLGNAHIDGNSENKDSPLFFNLFDFANDYGSDSDPAQLLVQYDLYVRVLLVLEKKDGELRWAQLKKLLTQLVDEAAAIYAVKKLLWCRLIDEKSNGIRNVFDSTSLEAIPLDDGALLCYTPTSDLYLNVLLGEYEYLATMATVSYHLFEDQTKLLRPPRNAVEEMKIVFSFLKTWQKIIIANCANSDPQNLLLFHTRGGQEFPWTKVADGFVRALDGKKKFHPEECEKFIMETGTLREAFLSAFNERLDRKNYE